MMINQSSEKYMTLLKENCSYSQCQGYITTHWRKKLFLKLFGVSRKFQKIHSLEPAEIVAYTVIINRNVCIDILEKENKHSINVQIDDKIKEISEDYDHIEKLIVADMVEKLPDIYRDVIMMKYFYGFKVNEISKQLHLSVGGVKSRLEKARKILRKDINDDE